MRRRGEGNGNPLRLASHFLPIGVAQFSQSFSFTHLTFPSSLFFFLLLFLFLGFVSPVPSLLLLALSSSLVLVGSSPAGVALFSRDPDFSP